MTLSASESTSVYGHYDEREKHSGRLSNESQPPIPPTRDSSVQAERSWRLTCRSQLVVLRNGARYVKHLNIEYKS